MCESIVVVGAALSADVDAPTERVHSAPGARRGQSPQQPTGERAGRENAEEVSRREPRRQRNLPVSPCLRPTAPRMFRVLEAVQSLTMASSPRNLSEPPPHLWVIPHFFTPVVLLL